MGFGGPVRRWLLFSGAGEGSRLRQKRRLGVAGVVGEVDKDETGEKATEGERFAEGESALIADDGDE